MIRTGWMKLIYAILLTAAVLFSVLYLGAFSVILLAILLILPILLLISTFYIKYNLEVSIETTGSTYHRNTPQAVRLVVKNKSFLPVGKAAASLICRSHITDEKIPVTLCFPIPARNVTTVEFTISVPHCGLTSIRMRKLQFTDYIRLFSRKLRTNAEIAVMILPSGTELKYNLEIPCSETDEESNLYSKLRAGDDPSEVYRIREYQPGDLQKRIHWKLSCRTDAVWVKEYSFPIRQRAAIIANYALNQTESLDSCDTALETVHTLSTALIKQDIPVTLYWMNSCTKQLMWNELHSMSELNDCMAALLTEKPTEDSQELLSQISEQASIHSTNAVYFCTPALSASEYEALSGTFCKNRLFVLTAEYPSLTINTAENIIYIRETSLSVDLQKLSYASEVMEE